MSLLFGIASWSVLLLYTQAQPSQQAGISPVQKSAIVASIGKEKTVRTSANENMQKFYGLLGDRATAEQSLQTLFEIAEKYELSLPQGEYKLKNDTASNSYRYQIIFPVKGSYSSIRQFCEQALLALPYASLDEWSFRRESISEDEVEVSLHFTLYLKVSAELPQAASGV
jgi:hypothetical protein